MSVKSIVDVQINDDEFKTFQAAFDKYRDQLARMPQAWAGINKEIKSSFEIATAALLAQGEMNRKRKEDLDFNRRSQDAWLSWTGLSRVTRDVASNIGRATTSLLKWVGIGGAISGLLGAGGLWGLDELAGTVAAGRRSSLGLGLSYGEQKAFATNFSRLVEPGAFLSAVNAARTDVTKRYAFYGAGLTEGQLAGKDTAQVAASLLPKLKELADRTPTALLAQVLQARGLDQFLSVEDFQRLKNTTPGEMRELEAGFSRDSLAFGLGVGTQKKWQEFTTQMSRAGQKIEAVFVRGLTQGHLPEAFTALSGSVAKAIGVFLTSPNLKQWITDFGKGVEGAAKYIGSPKFQNDIRTFAVDIDFAAKKVVSALQFLGLIPGSTNPNDWNDRDKAQWNRTHPDKRVPLSRGSMWNDDPNRPFSWWDPGSWLSGNGGFLSKQNDAKAEEAVEFLMKKGRSRAYAAGVVGALLGDNSSLDPFARDYQTGTHVGLAQESPERQGHFMRVMGYPFGLSSWRAQLDFFDKEIQGTGLDPLSAQAGRDVQGLTDARRIAAIITKEALRPSNAEFASSVGRRMDAAAKLASRQAGPHKTVRVVIENNTGANVVISANQAAAVR